MSSRVLLRSALLLFALAALAAAACDDCECESRDEDYCDLWGDAVQCVDGCHFEKVTCPEYDDCADWCADGQCFTNCDCPDTHCSGPEDNECVDADTLHQCIDLGDGCDAQLVDVECSIPSVCPGGSGCALNDDGIAACWCDEGDGGA